MPKQKQRGRPAGSVTLSYVTVACLLQKFGPDAEVPVGTRFINLNNLEGKSVQAVAVVKKLVDEQRAVAKAEAVAQATLAAATSAPAEVAVAETSLHPEAHAPLSIVAGD